MKLTEAKTSVDGKTLHCVFDDGRECAFPYPIPAAVRKGRLAEYADEAQAWLDRGNVPGPILSAAEAAAERDAAKYLVAAEREREQALVERAKALAVADADAAAAARLDARIAKLASGAARPGLSGSDRH
jgi:hypothetical protein